MANYFRVKSSVHVNEKGRVYEKGDVVETEKDLIATFGAEKFEKASASNFSADALPGADVESEDEGERGDEVTDKFEGAAGSNFRVFKRHGVYSVYNANDLTEPLNEEEFTRKDQVAAYISELS